MPEINLLNLLIIFAWSIVFLWLAGFIWTQYCLKKQSNLKLDNKTRIEKETFVSILVPARNEGNRVLEKSISSMLDQTYKNYELIVLNDRSTDDTSNILEELKTHNPQSAIRIMNGVKTPKNWLGKPHALQQAFKEAKGEWILATDADIIFSPETLQNVVSYAEENNFDSLTLIPKLIFGSFWETFFFPIFGWFCILIMPLHRVNDPNRKESMGIGNFFMFKREVLEEIGGFESVKREVAEDLKLAEIIKEKGFRLQIDYAPDLIKTRMYEGFKEIWSGFTKNLFSGMKFSIARTFFGVNSILLFGVLPLFASLLALFFGQIQIFIPLLIIYLLQASTISLVHRHWKSNTIYSLLAPFGLLLFSLILINSAVKVLSGKGVNWKGRTIYGQSGIRPPIT